MGEGGVHRHEAGTLLQHNMAHGHGEGWDQRAFTRECEIPAEQLQQLMALPGWEHTMQVRGSGETGGQQTQGASEQGNLSSFRGRGATF